MQENFSFYPRLQSCQTQLLTSKTNPCLTLSSHRVLQSHAQQVLTCLTPTPCPHSIAWYVSDSNEAGFIKAETSKLRSRVESGRSTLSSALRASHRLPRRQTIQVCSDAALQDAHSAMPEVKVNHPPGGGRLGGVPTARTGSATKDWSINLSARFAFQGLYRLHVVHA
jgi:hypothetical protein